MDIIEFLLLFGGGSSDTIPDAFTITAQTGVALSTTITSASFEPTGYTSDTTITVSGLAYQINGVGGFTTGPGTLSPGDTLEVQLDSASTWGTATSGTITVGGVEETFTVTTAYNLGFETAAYDASWTSPIMTAGTLADADFTWHQPDGNTFTGKAPAITNFSQVGVYYVECSDWSKVTGIKFAQSTTGRNFLKKFPDIASISQVLTGLTSLREFAKNNSLTDDAITDISNITSLTDIYAGWQSCGGADGSIPDLSNLVNLTTTQAAWYFATNLTGPVPDISGIVGLTNIANMVGYDTNLTLTDISPWTWGANISEADMSHSKVSYNSSGGCLSANVNNAINLNLTSCNLTVDMINNICIDLDTTGNTGMTVNISSNTAPTGAGLTAYNSLVSKGNTMTRDI